MKPIEQEISIKMIDRMNVVIYLILTGLFVYGWWTDQLMV